jgi:hypothetical protein
MMKPGDRVLIHDGSEAHGDAGTIYTILEHDGAMLVELDDSGGTLWPCFPWEVTPEGEEVDHGAA